jgi:hypothetical protein
MHRFAILLIAGLVLAGCSKSHQPPVGRWIGHYESPVVMVVAWMEIAPRGDIKVSAPDLLDIGEPSDEQREAAHRRLANQLYDSWGDVQPRHYEFDGHVFRKPGGVAPQMEWNPKTRRMTVVFYFGMQRSIRIPMQPVKEFTEDSWLGL